MDDIEKKKKWKSPNGANPPHEPTENSRKKVKDLAGVGTPQEDIGKVIGVDRKTLRKYYREELDTALITANFLVAGALFQKAISGDIGAGIWWEKTRAGKSDKMTVDMNQRINIVEIDSEDKDIF